MNMNEEFARQHAGRVFEADWGVGQRPNRWMVVGFCDNRVMISYEHPVNQKLGNSIKVFDNPTVLIEAEGYWATHVDNVKNKKFVEPSREATGKVSSGPSETPDTGVHPGVKRTKWTVTEESA